MKTILSVVILSLLSVTAVAAPKKRAPNQETIHDDVYVCKNSETDLTYVVNRKTGTLRVFVNDHTLGNGLDKEIKNVRLDNLIVKEEFDKLDNGKELVTYTFKKTLGSRNKIERAIFELELEKGNGTSEVSYAEGKVMDVKPNDVEDFEVNLHCRSSKN